jgi:hypothetical protein
VGQDVWIYLLGPFLALFPARWRKALPISRSVRWRSAAILSGMAESAVALAALMYWYWYSMSTSLSRLSDLALSGKTAPLTTDHDLGTAALLIWSTHPLTWVIAFFGIEGMVRLCAAFTDTVLGVSPLYLVGKIYSKIAHGGEPQAPDAVKFSQGHVSSYVGALRDKVAVSKLSQVPDELRVTKNSSEEILEIRACREKQEWAPPRVVRYADRYYRLEECSRGPAPRPFVYKLRRLPAGVPSRTVLIYSPDGEPVIASR